VKNKKGGEIVNQLQVFKNLDELTIDSREVAEMVEKNHAHLLRDIKTYIEYLLTNPKLDSLDFFIISTYMDSKGEERPNYQITKKGCEFIAHKLTGQKGAIFTATYINRFHEMEENLSKPSYMLSNPIERAKKWIVEEERRQLLEGKIEEQKPKVIFADAVSASHTTILVGELAKLLRQNGVQMGQNRLFDWLRFNGFLIKRRGTDYNMPTQYSMELGLFEVKETSITKPDGHIMVSKTPKVTGKGQQYFINKLMESKEG